MIQPVVVQSLGSMTEKFPVLAQSTVSALSEFLVRPSPILVKLNMQAGGSVATCVESAVGGHDGAKPGFSVTVTDDEVTASLATFPTSNGVGRHSSAALRGQKSKLKACAIFERLRDAAIENICKLVTRLYSRRIT